MYIKIFFTMYSESKNKNRLRNTRKLHRIRHLTVQFGVPTIRHNWPPISLDPLPFYSVLPMCISQAFWCKVFAAFSIFYESSFCVNTLSTEGIAVGRGWNEPLKESVSVSVSVCVAGNNAQVVSFN